MKKTHMIILGLLAASILLSAYAYPRMPDRVASHWNASGQVDGYMGKFWGAFLMPAVLSVLALVFIAIPYIDPLKENILEFRKHYDRFIVILFLFMIYVQIHSILWNLGRQVSPNKTMPIALGLLFYFVGVLCENAKRNWFIGIRTPWTLSSDTVWEKTNKLGGKLFKLAGAIAILSALLVKNAILFIVAPALLITAYTVVYSYLEYRKETQ